MTRQQLEHIIRAAGTIADDKNIIVIGSQAILATKVDLPKVMVQSMEADVFPESSPDLSDLIDGCIGELSPFHEQFGYDAQGVGPETAKLPAGWRGRLIEIKNENTNGICGKCLSASDLIISKCLAGREKDREFVQAALSSKIVTPEQIYSLKSELSNEETLILQERLSRWQTQPLN